MSNLVELRRPAFAPVEKALPKPSSQPSPVPLSQRARRLAVLARDRLVAPTAENIHAVNLAITYFCNSRCTMCSIWQIYKEDRTKAAAELSLADIEGIFSSRHFRNLRAIGLTGGEPFLRRDLPDIAGYFLTTFPTASLAIPTDSVSPKLTISTVKKIVQRHQPGRNRLAISVSLDGLQEAHDRQRGLPCFDKALEVLRELAPLDLALNVSFTITAINAADVLATYRLVKSMGATFNCQFANASSNYYGSNSMQLANLNEAQVALVEEQVRTIADERWQGLSLKARLTDTNDHFLRHMVDYHRNPRRIFSCHSGTHSCFVDPYGDVYPCIMLDQKLGNARAQGFDAVWNGEAAADVRRSIAAQKCHCWTPCEAGPSLGKSLTPLPSISHLVK